MTVYATLIFCLVTISVCFETVEGVLVFSLYLLSELLNVLKPQLIQWVMRILFSLSGCDELSQEISCSGLSVESTTDQPQNQR